jgi:hypothetical protein
MNSRHGGPIFAAILLLAAGSLLPVTAMAQAHPARTKSGGTITQTPPDTSAKMHHAPTPTPVPATPPPAQAAITTVQVTSAPPPAKSQAPPLDAGMFSRGRKRVSVVAGWAHSFDDDYLLLGIGAGYFIRNGIDVGLDFEGWFIGDPTVYKLSPRVDYVLWKMQRVKPYAGAFYRWNFVGGGFEDQKSLGGRVGAYYKGDRGGMAGAGVVYERYLNLDDRLGSSDVIYPEFFFAVSF